MDADVGRVRFLRVDHGGIPGFGATPSFIPVEAVTSVGDEVRVDRSAAVVAEAPCYDPDVVDLAHSRAVDYYGRLSGYYGVPLYLTRERAVVGQTLAIPEAFLREVAAEDAREFPDAVAALRPVIRVAGPRISRAGQPTTDAAICNHWLMHGDRMA